MVPTGVPNVLVLAVDTTTRGGSVAVARDDEVLALVEGDAARTHGERMPGEIAMALDRAGVAASAVELLAVASGPGAFTGLRIGLAAVQGLAMTLGTPVVGVSALDAHAKEAMSRRGAATRVAVWMDAQRGEVYSALYEPAGDPDRPWREVAGPAATTPGATLAAWGHPGDAVLFVGDGARHHRAFLDAAGQGRWDVADHEAPLAPAIAWIGRRDAARGLAGPPHALQPLYVRRPDAELERERRLTP